MCGITGWVDFGRDLRDERLTLDAMTETMTPRGPDAAGVWLQRRIGLGHRRLAVIDIEGGSQPMVASRDDGSALAALTFSGEIYNFVELRHELEARGHRFRTRSDTEVVLEGYLEWGDAIAERLNGMFAFALWDARAERLVLVRDRMGVKPLYVAATPDGALFGSEPKAILAHPEFRAEVDLDGLRQLLSRLKTPNAAPWKGMREVRPGTVVTVSATGIEERTYWRLEGWEHRDDIPTTVATVRGLLEDIVSRQLVADVPLCTLLSGGLDSSAITALAAAQLSARKEGPVRTFSVDFVGQGDHFRTAAAARTHDTPYVHEVSQRIGSRHTDIVLGNDQLLDPEVRAAVVRARDLPVGGGDFDISLLLLFRAIREHSTVALSGESADEVFGGYAWFHGQRAVAADTFPWMGTGRTRLPMFDQALVHTLDLDAFVAESYRDALAEVPHIPGTSPLERRMREVCYLALTRFVQTLLDRKDRMSMATGLEVRVPFCDHRLVEYVFNTPWAFKTFDGREKSLLRAAAADVLPSSVLERRKSPYPVTRDPGYAVALRGELRALLDDPSSPIFDLVDAAAVRRVADATSGRGARARVRWARRGMERVLALHNWLREYEPAVVT